MKLDGEVRIEAPIDQVWQALNDPDVLARAVPGAESLERLDDNRFEGKVKAKVGPVSARFSGQVTLSDIDPPNGYRITGEGKGGAAGFAKGGAQVQLRAESDDVTILTYQAEGQVGGKLAQIGQRLVTATAEKMATAFFTNLAQEFEAQQGNTEVMENQKEAQDSSDQHENQGEHGHQGGHGHHADHGPSHPVEVDDSGVGAGASTGVWVTGLLCVVLLLLAFFAL